MIAGGPRPIKGFLDPNPPGGPTCLVLDVRLPGQSGLDLQRELALAKRDIPIVFVTGHGDIPMSVQAMKGGAVEFLTKPVSHDVLLSAIKSALTRSQAALSHEAEIQELRDLFGLLTGRNARSWRW